MTIDHITIETQEQADAVPSMSLMLTDGGARYVAGGGDPAEVGRPAEVGKDAVTHIAIPVADAIEARATLLTWVCGCQPGTVCGNGCHDLRPIADLILPPPLAERQAQPAPTCAEVLTETIDDIALRMPAWWVERARAALDAEGAK